MKFNLRTLFAVILMIAITCAALKFRTPFWACIVLSIALGAPFVFIFASLINGSRRLACFSFAIVCLSYLALVLIEPLQRQARRYPTSRCIAVVLESFIEDDVAGAALRTRRSTIQYANAEWPVAPPHRLVEFLSFELVCQSLWALLLGSLAGLAVSQFTRRRRKTIHTDQQETSGH